MSFVCVCVSLSITKDLANRWTVMVLLYNDAYFERFITLLGSSPSSPLKNENPKKMREKGMWNNHSIISVPFLECKSTTES